MTCRGSSGPAGTSRGPSAASATTDGDRARRAGRPVEVEARHGDGWVKLVGTGSTGTQEISARAGPDLRSTPRSPWHTSSARVTTHSSRGAAIRPDRGRNRRHRARQVGLPRLMAERRREGVDDPDAGQLDKLPVRVTRARPGFAATPRAHAGAARAPPRERPHSFGRACRSSPNRRQRGHHTVVPREVLNWSRPESRAADAVGAGSWRARALPARVIRRVDERAVADLTVRAEPWPSRKCCSAERIICVRVVL